MEVYETCTLRLAQRDLSLKCQKKKKKDRETPSLPKISFTQKDRGEAFVPTKLC